MTNYVMSKGAGHQQPHAAANRRAIAENLKMQTPGLANGAGRAASPSVQGRLSNRGVSRSSQPRSLFADTSYESSTTDSVTEVPAGFDAEAHMRQFEHMDQLSGVANWRRAQGHLPDAFDDDEDGEEDGASELSDEDPGQKMGASAYARPQTSSSWPVHSENGALSDNEIVEQSTKGPANVDDETPQDKEDEWIPDTMNVTHEAPQVHERSFNDTSASRQHQTSYISDLNKDYQQVQNHNKQQNHAQETLKRKFATPHAENTKPHTSLVQKEAMATQAGIYLPDRPVRPADFSHQQPPMDTPNGITNNHEATRFLQPAPQAVHTQDLDYDFKMLKAMNFETLMQESFDHDPSRQHDVKNNAKELLEVELKKMLQTTPEMQYHFLSSLSLQEWQDAGEWFKAELAALNQRMLDSREKRRHATMNFEEQVAKRYKAVVQEDALYDVALSGMSETGSTVLMVGTPKRRR